LPSVPAGDQCPRTQSGILAAVSVTRTIPMVSRHSVKGSSNDHDWAVAALDMR